MPDTTGAEQGMTLLTTSTYMLYGSGTVGRCCICIYQMAALFHFSARNEIMAAILKV